MWIKEMGLYKRGRDEIKTFNHFPSGSNTRSMSKKYLEYLNGLIQVFRAGLAIKEQWAMNKYQVGLVHYFQELSNTLKVLNFEVPMAWFGN